MFLPSTEWLTADGSEDLEGHVSDLLHSEGQEPLLSQELKGADAQQLKHDADVTFMFKPVQHSHTGAAWWQLVMRNIRKWTNEHLPCGVQDLLRGCASSAAHNLWSSSNDLISSNTAISDMATSRKQSMFFTILTATCSSLWDWQNDMKCNLCYGNEEARKSQNVEEERNNIYMILYICLCVCIDIQLYIYRLYCLSYNILQ